MSLSPFACLSTHEVCKPRNYSLNEQKHLQVRDWLALYFDIPALNRCNIINWHASLPKFVNLKLEQIIILHLLQQKKFSIWDLFMTWALQFFQNEKVVNCLSLFLYQWLISVKFSLGWIKFTCHFMLGWAHFGRLGDKEYELDFIKY